MKNKITNLKISNFKSIKEAELECGRINLFVGKPNVGKSNVLEAISLLGASYSNSEKFMNEFIRYEEFNNLFFDQETENIILIESNIGTAGVKHSYKNNVYYFLIGSLIDIIDEFEKDEPDKNYANTSSKRDSIVSKLIACRNEDGSQAKVTSIKDGNYSPVKFYLFDKKTLLNDREKSFLLPPRGKNLLKTILSHKSLRDEIDSFFEEYQLNVIYDSRKGNIEILKELGKASFSKLPYSLIADTLQRIIFHYAAIFSNKDSVILFEEPESHSFPPYIRELALKIIESTENQYFITTHSPYLFDTILEKTAPEDLALFVTYFENYETKFKKLNDEEISKIMDSGLEVFFNLNHFVNE